MSELAQKLTGGVFPGGDSEEALDNLFKFVPTLRTNVERRTKTLDRVKRSLNTKKGS